MEPPQEGFEPSAAGSPNAVSVVVTVLSCLPEFRREAFQEVLPADGLLLTDGWAQVERDCTHLDWFLSSPGCENAGEAE